MSDASVNGLQPARRKADELRGRASAEGRFGLVEALAAQSQAQQQRNNSASHDPDSSDLPTQSHGFLTDENNSFLQKHATSDAPSESASSESLDERELHRHFMDVESSFLPDTAHPPQQHEESRFGADDTYLELVSPAHARAEIEEHGRSDTHTASTLHHGAGDLSHISEYENEDLANTSSPAQAASHRTNARSFKGSAQDRQSTEDGPETPASRPTSQSTARPGSKGSTVRPFSPAETENNVNQNRPSMTSDYRKPSFQSTVSTDLSSDISTQDSTADMAIQTGGSNFGGSILATRRADLAARLPSFASTVSQRDWPETPRINGSKLLPPTDTVLAQRVNSIQVPETIARDFRARNRTVSPEKRPASAGGPGNAFQDKSRRTLTLKEQNSKVDKLTKENFDLKLKIHFLDQALQSRSDDGVKELIDKNVELQTDLANERKESQTLRRKLRELEKKVKEQGDQLLQARLQKSEGDDDEDDPTLQAEMHQEILYLRQQLDRTENQVTTLREEVMTKEFEKRKMADHMRSMAGNRNEDTAGMKETMDMWQDLLNAETGRREQAEDDLKKAREDLQALRLQHLAPSPREEFAKGRSRSANDIEDDTLNGESDTASTLVEQLRHENAELRRDLGAQTSMLTSRNRERERLQQEVEELKLLQRRGDTRSIAGDSIFDRSISRAQARPSSRGSEMATGSHVTETEREDWEKREGHLRDQNAELRLKHQELERTHQTHLQYTTTLETDFQEMENELNDASEDLKALQGERDEALAALEEKEAEYKKLEDEAVTEIDKLIKEIEGLEAQLQEQHKKMHKTQTKLEHTTDGYRGLQSELREITQSVMNLEDEKQANLRNIQTLEQQLADAEEEIQTLEQKYSELHEKHRKLEVTQESLHSEITFLREEQEGDKIRIGELEDALNAAQQMAQDEQDKLRDMEQSIIEEREQRDVLENKSKEEVQKVLDDLNNESGRSKDEVRKLRRALSAKEVEANSFRQKLEELESSLRFILGEPNGTKQTLLADIERIQRELESTANQLDRTKMEVADKDRLLRHRDGLLESTSLESRRLSDLLDKERAARKYDLEQFEKSSRGQATHMRQAAQQESRILELETAYSQDKRRMAAQEEHYHEQLNERNLLLLALWNRLSTLCGVEWSQNNALVNGEVPSVDVIARGLPAFNRNVLAAVKTIESLIGSFKVRIRTIEKELLRDYQTIEHNLEMRMRRMDDLERTVAETQDALDREHQLQNQLPPPSRGSTLSRPFKSSEETIKLKNEIKQLRAELKFHRQHPSAIASQMLNQQQQSTDQLSRRASTSAGSSSSKNQVSPARAVFSLLSRNHSNASHLHDQQFQQQFLPLDHISPERKRHSVTIPFPTDSASTTHHQQALAPNLSLSNAPSIAPSSNTGSGSEPKWIHRLKELERRLKQEREARLLDRKGARQRLEEGRLENAELRSLLEREKSRRELMAVDAEHVMNVSDSRRRESRRLMEGDSPVHEEGQGGEGSGKENYEQEGEDEGGLKLTSAPDFLGMQRRRSRLMRGGDGEYYEQQGGEEESRGYERYREDGYGEEEDFLPGLGREGGVLGGYGRTVDEDGVLEGREEQHGQGRRWKA